MHKINKKLQNKNLTLENVREIQLMWINLNHPTQKAKDSTFFKESKKHLSPQKINEIEKMNPFGQGKFSSSLLAIKQGILLTKKFELEGLVKIKMRKGENCNPNLNESIKLLIPELITEKNALRELYLNSTGPVKKLFQESIPNEFYKIIK